VKVPKCPGEQRDTKWAAGAGREAHRVQDELHVRLLRQRVRHTHAARTRKCHSSCAVPREVECRWRGGKWSADGEADRTGPDRPTVAGIERKSGSVQMYILPECTGTLFTLHREKRPSILESFMWSLPQSGRRKTRELTTRHKHGPAQVTATAPLPASDALRFHLDPPSPHALAPALGPGGRGGRGHAGLRRGQISGPF